MIILNTYTRRKDGNEWQYTMERVYKASSVEEIVAQWPDYARAIALIDAAHPESLDDVGARIPSGIYSVYYILVGK